MSVAESKSRPPTILSIRTGAEWEVAAIQIATEANIDWVNIASVEELFSLEGNDLSGTCLLIDAEHPTMDWTALHDGMLEKRIEIPVIAIAPAGDVSPIIEGVANCANFVLSQPIERSLLLETIDFAYNNEHLLHHRFAVERSYRLATTLKERERAILSMAVGGAPNKQIARKLGVHIKTVERIRNIAYTKLSVRSTAEMTRLLTLAELYDFIRPSPTISSPTIHSGAGFHGVPFGGLQATPVRS